MHIENFEFLCEFEFMCEKAFWPLIRGPGCVNGKNRGSKILLHCPFQQIASSNYMQYCLLSIVMADPFLIINLT
jgi:hypothetical protein